MKIVNNNSRKTRNYRIVKVFKAGIVLKGGEIKSLRNSQSSIEEAYVHNFKNELYVNNFYIHSYKNAHSADLQIDTKRRRKLLLNRSEIDEIIFESKSKNYVILPLLLFINDKGLAKIEIALAQQLKKYQIKNEIKDREIKRSIAKDLLSIT
jgi:SsrA-binding protein